jgi:acetyltransferase-like isoleucine patch superfamily enzyme
MRIIQFIQECYGHIISQGPSNSFFSVLRFHHYAPKLKRISGTFISCSGLFIEGPENVVIGNNVFFNRNVFIASVIGCVESEIVISDNCLFGPNVVVVAGDHSYLNRDSKIRFQDTIPGKIFIGEDCWIGANVTITKDVTIGEGSVIGANSVVTHDIPAYSIAGGVPARIIKSRTNDGLVQKCIK